MKIILGSSSKYRKAVLEKHGYHFEVVSPDIDEKAIRTDDFYQLPLLIAQAKMDALLKRVSEPAVVIAADQVVVCNGQLREKPQSESEAKEWMKIYGEGYPGETVSAVVVVNTQNGKRASGVDIAKTYFKQIPDSVIDEYVNVGDPYSKAGGFSIQSPVTKEYLDKTEGTEDSIMGMPIMLLERLMKEVEAT